MEPQRATEERCRGPHPCTWCGRHTRYRAALSRRRSWPIPPANCAEAAHDRWKCVIRTGDKLRFCLRLSVAKNKHLLVWCCCQSSLRAAANTGHASLIPLSLSSAMQPWQISSRSANPRMLPALALVHGHIVYSGTGSRPSRDQA